MIQRLPASLTAFVGRAAECDELVHLLQQRHLVTLTAPGGMGKTRLAITAAAQSRFPDGVVFIALPSPAQLTTVITSTADVLNFTFHQEMPPEEQLFDYLRDKKILLVFDNVDQPAPDLVRWFTSLAAASPTLLITSQERLQTRGETVYHLKGLTPDDALNLFEDTARQVQPQWILNEQHRKTALRICQQVGGMPLGIVLAAAWVEVLSLEEIEAEIAANLDFLCGDFQDLPPHQHQLKEVLRAAWMRLTPLESETLARLAVFRGGFTRAAAQTVANAQPETLKKLIGRSLLWRDAISGRYSLHELLRQYGIHQLDTLETDARDRHADYFARWVSQQSARLLNHQQNEAAELLTADWENINAAWTWAVETGSVAQVDLMLEPLYFLFNLQSRWSAGEAFFWQAAERWMANEADETMQIRLALRGAHLALMSRDDPELTPDILARVEGIARRALSTETDIPFARYVYGHFLIASEGYAQALTVLYESRDLFEDQPYFMAHVYHLMGFASSKLHDEPQALRFAQQSVAISRGMGDTTSLAMFLVNAGSFLMWQGYYAEARRCFEEAKQDRNWSRVLWVEQCLGSLAFYDGDFAALKQSAHKVLEMARHYGYRSGLELATQNLYMAALAQGNYIEAWELYTHADRLPPAERAFGLALAEIGLNDYNAACEHLLTVFTEGQAGRKIYALCGAACVLVQRGDLALAAELLSFVWHHRLRSRVFIERIPLFNNLRGYLEKRLPPHLFAEKWARGQMLDISHAVDNVVLQLNEPHTPRMLMIAPKMPDALSARESEILALVAKGLSNQAIAGQLVIGVNTVKKHITHIYSKLGVTSRTQALLKARELHLL